MAVKISRSDSRAAPTTNWVVDEGQLPFQDKVGDFEVLISLIHIRGWIKSDRKSFWGAKNDKALEWGCSKCKGAEYADQDWKRPARGCEGTDVAALAFEFDPDLRQCPWSQIDFDTRLVLQWYRDYEDFGIFPFGSDNLLREPAYVYEAFRIIKDATHGEQRRRAAKAEAEYKRESKRRR